MRWDFGLEPLDQTMVASGLLRSVIAQLLAAEDDEPAVASLLADLRRVEAALEHVPARREPRVGAAVNGDGRPYLDHAFDIGRYNPCFPDYDITVDGGTAVGSVEFPIVYEGPPGFVHGGFLGLFVDCVVQHHNCEVGVAGKTTSMSVSYRRPAPLDTRLSFTIRRETIDDRIRSQFELSDGDRVLCSATVDAVAGVRSNLPAVSPRRVDPHRDTG